MAARGAIREKWTPWRLQRLRTLWKDRTITVAAIAERLGMTTSATYAKANELGLPSRYPDRASPRRTA